ncbi:MAG: hypothetical protein RR314_03560 [Oscillospiraceae bacterium]
MKITGYLFRGVGARRPAGNAGMLPLIVLFAFFVGGSVAGSLLGGKALAGTAGEALLLSDGRVYAAVGYLPLFFSCAKYHIAILLFATSLLGVFLIPCAMAVRGFVLACTAVTLAASYPGLRGVLISLVVLGIPSLITVPCLFLLGRDGLCMSIRLIALFDRRPPLPLPGDAVTDISVTAIALCLASAVEYFAVPALISMLI